VAIRSENYISLCARLMELSCTRMCDGGGWGTKDHKILVDTLDALNDRIREIKGEQPMSMNVSHILTLLDQTRAEVEALGQATDIPKPTGLGAMVLEVAREEIGNGEEGGNNAGPHVARYKRRSLGLDDDKDQGSWCASFLSWCIEEACGRMGIAMPIRPSHGAKQLGKRIAAAGSKVEVPMPGDVVVWDRGKLKPGGKPSWMGHVGIVERVELGAGTSTPSILHTIEGNVGAFPSVVRRFAHDLSRQDRIELFAAFPDGVEDLST